MATGKRTLVVRTIGCVATATVLEADSPLVVVNLLCQLPGGRPQHRRQPYQRNATELQVEGAGPFQTLAEFTDWVSATYVEV